MTLSHIAVLIPARDEERLLPRCLRSVLGACTALPLSVTTDIVVAVDSSTDGTYDIARHMLRSHGCVVKTEAGCVGTARICAAQTAMSRYQGTVESLWFANTDADCRVPEDWLLNQLRIAESGVGAVAGIVDVDSFAEHQDGVEKRFRENYRLNADGSHRHVHGANLGVRADAYLNAGGWSALHTAEDHDLWHRLHEAGTLRASVTAISVLTSGRRVGRAPDGFAGTLGGFELSAPLTGGIL